MRVLCLDQTGSFLDFPLRCMEAGHTVKTAMAKDKRTGKRRMVGDGLIDKIENEAWQPWAKWADLIVCSDNTKWLRELDVLKKKGFPVFAPSYESAELELTRSKGQAAFKAAGINVMPYEAFSDYRKAEKLVLSTMERYVSKPDGDVDKALSYVSKGPRDMLYMLKRWSESPKNAGRKFMLQGFVPGVEFSVNGWMGRDGFAQYMEEAFEFKKLMPGNFGPNTGEMGTAIKYVKHSQLAEEVLRPLEPLLKKLGHTGSVDVSVIVDENGDPRPLEFTSRNGWPAFNIVQPLHPDPCEWMADLLDGKDTFRPLTDHAVGFVLPIPDFPYSHFTQKEIVGVPVYGMDNENPYRPYLQPCELMAGSAPDEIDGRIVMDAKVMVSAGDYLAVATGLGDTVRRAKKEAEKARDSIEIPNNMLCRIDIGDRLEEDLPILQSYGFATEWKY